MATALPVELELPVEAAGVLAVSATTTDVADVATTALLEVLVAVAVGVVAAGVVLLAGAVLVAGADVLDPLLLLVPAAAWRADRMAS